MRRVRECWAWHEPCCIEIGRLVRWLFRHWEQVFDPLSYSSAVSTARASRTLGLLIIRFSFPLRSTRSREARGRVWELGHRCRRSLDRSLGSPGPVPESAGIYWFANTACGRDLGCGRGPRCGRGYSSCPPLEIVGGRRRGVQFFCEGDSVGSPELGSGDPSRE